MPKPDGRLAHIDPVKTVSWEEPVFLTFDVDWACDEVLGDTIDIVENANVAVTWFVTHRTPLLERLRSNEKFELGIHPNFNFLLNGDPRNGANVPEVVDRLLAVVPEARSVRSHSLVQGSRILQTCAAKGLTHNCSHFIPASSGIELRPWRGWNGLVEVPYLWADDIACIDGPNVAITDLARLPGLRVFGFHPIHVFLNTEHMDRYERTRNVHDKPGELIKHRNTGAGTRTALETLLHAL
jgi:hypothetical protein